MIYAGFFLSAGLGSEDGHLPTFWLLLQILHSRKRGSQRMQRS